MKNLIDNVRAPFTVPFFVLTVLLVCACGSDQTVQNEPPTQVSTGQVTRPDESDRERLGRLRHDALRWMVAAAQRALDIGPFQIRIDKASTTALTDLAGAIQQMEQVVIDLEGAVRSGHSPD